MKYSIYHSGFLAIRDRMNGITTLVALLLVGVASCSPISKGDENLRINTEFFANELVLYTAQNDIIKLHTPLNSLNFEDDSDSDSDEDIQIFFVEAVKGTDGKIVNTVYLLKEKKASKILEHGNDIASSSDDSKQVFFGASDGIYVYDAKTNAAEKYGTVTDNVVGIAKENGTDVIYILTDEHVVYKVSEEGTVKEKIDKVKDARQIVVDFQNNLYYVDGEKDVYVYSGGEVTKIKGLPSNPSYIALVNPPFVLEDSVPLVAGKKAFTIYANGTSEFSEIVLDVHPTAYSMEASIIQYYAYDKKIYEYNILAILLGSLLEEIKEFFDDKVEQIQSIATRSRKDFGA